MLVGPKGRESLPPAIFDLLWMFLSRPGQLITHKAASELLGQGEISDGYLRTSVARLRRKLSLVGLNPACLALVRSEGYALDPDAGIEVCDGMGERPQGSPGRLAPFASQER
jgi:DNA-binding response OmpR family regulator